MTKVELRPSARALRRQIAVTHYHHRFISAGTTWEGGYTVRYRPMADRWSFSPSWCCLLVVPSDEEVE